MSAPAWTPGPWVACNMIHADRGDRMTPDEIGEYVAGCVRKSMEHGGSTDFLFVTTGPEGSPDICHVGNGPRGPYNARLIAAAPDLAEAASAALTFIDAMAVEWGVGIDEAEALRAALAKAHGQ